MGAALEKDDAIITAYRCHGYTYVKGTWIVFINTGTKWIDI
jgi:TPP-dependent pyruvate/acetoin dehydrogenase alpha subunit